MKVHLSVVEVDWLKCNAISIREGTLGALTREADATSSITRTQYSAHTMLLKNERLGFLLAVSIPNC